jgi:hypothetical protein
MPVRSLTAHAAGCAREGTLTGGVRLERLAGMASGDVRIELTPAEVETLIDALDALEYWQFGDVLPRNNGFVFIPGDVSPDADRYWGPDPQMSEGQAEAIDHVRRCRDLAARLQNAAATEKEVQ